MSRQISMVCVACENNPSVKWNLRAEPGDDGSTADSGKVTSCGTAKPFPNTLEC